MDLSKLPKMSDTRRAEADRQGQAPPPSSSAPLPAADAASPPPYAGRVVATGTHAGLADSDLRYRQRVLR